MNTFTSPYFFFGTANLRNYLTMADYYFANRQVSRGYVALSLKSGEVTMGVEAPETVGPPVHQSGFGKRISKKGDYY